jgi:hypothetical protein
MVSRSPTPLKRERREDDDDKSRRRKKLEKVKEPAAKDADKEPLFDDTKFVVELLRSAFTKLEGVGEAFDIKAHHDVYKDPSMQGLTFRIHGFAEKLRTSLWSSRLPTSTSSSMTAAPTAATTVTAAMAVTTAGLRLIDRLLYQLVVCAFVSLSGS